ncbi:MAG TPA: Hpt domain-containing protein, partial [Kofleriaceae bacterium]
MALEQSPDDSAIVARIFRTIHTIKGTCGFLGFGKLEAVSHAGENVLSAVRDEEIAPTPTMTTVLLAMVDAIRELLAQIETTGAEGDGEYAVLIDQLTMLYRGGTPVLSPATDADAVAPPPAPPPA